jgi:hypothetical protein
LAVAFFLGVKQGFSIADIFSSCQLITVPQLNNSLWQLNLGTRLSLPNFFFCRVTLFRIFQIRAALHESSLKFMSHLISCSEPLCSYLKAPTYRLLHSALQDIRASAQQPPISAAPTRTLSIDLNIAFDADWAAPRVCFIVLVIDDARICMLPRMGHR